MVSFRSFLPSLHSHERRFIYHKYDCVRIIDLGDWSERETGHPIPLVCIAIRKDKPFISFKKDIEFIPRNSVQYAFDHAAASREFVKTHAQELDDEVIDEHIKLYINDLTLSLGDKGNRAVQTLEDMAKWKTIA